MSLKIDNSTFFAQVHDIRFPTYNEKKELSRLHNLFRTAYDEAIHLTLLQKLFFLTDAKSTTNPICTQFERCGTCWKYVGFSQENPLWDISFGGGQLAMECLIYFLEKHPVVASFLIRKQMRINEFDYEHYPWATAGIRLVNMLAMMFEFHDTHFTSKSSGTSTAGSSSVSSGTDNIPWSYGRKEYWSFIKERKGFHRLFVVAVLLFDLSWIEMRDKYVLNPLENFPNNDFIDDAASPCNKFSFSRTSTQPVGTPSQVTHDGVCFTESGGGYRSPIKASRESHGDSLAPHVIHNRNNPFIQQYSTIEIVNMCVCVCFRDQLEGHFLRYASSMSEFESVVLERWKIDNDFMA